ncbi:MAG TPA: hypothetical protein VGS18_05880 [Thermoplasmata archaeon]|nr:hypothetical protein [Thermoplasmata archaeon]
MIALAREEERLERVRGRESGAADQWVTGPRGPLQEYGVEWKGFRDLLDQHHLRLEARLEASATAVAPNLSKLLGPKIAARLIAASGGLSALSRMTSARLQLLGSRRRPGGGRGPKYGTIARAVLAADVPAARRGAYARSLAGLAAIAGRADATTHRSIAAELVRRRDRRAAELRRGRVP